MPSSSTIHSATLSREPGVALHRQLYIVLRDQIMRGVFAVDSAIPNETELQTMFGVSRITVRRAVADLEAHGLVRKFPGRGTFVLPRPGNARQEASMTIMESLNQSAKETQVKVLLIETVTAPGAMAFNLGVGVGGQALHILRLRVAGKIPLMLTEAWVEPSLAPHINAKALRDGPLFEIILRNGIRFGKVMQEVTAVAADPQQANLLQTAVGRPLIQRTRLHYSVSGQPIYQLTATVSPERTRLLTEIPSGQVHTLTAGHFQHTIML